jgi:hypothetical protein
MFHRKRAVRELRFIMSPVFFNAWRECGVRSLSRGIRRSVMDVMAK